MACSKPLGDEVPLPLFLQLALRTLRPEMSSSVSTPDNAGQPAHKDTAVLLLLQLPLQ